MVLVSGYQVYKVTVASLLLSQAVGNSCRGKYFAEQVGQFPPFTVLAAAAALPVPCDSSLTESGNLRLQLVNGAGSRSLVEYFSLQ
jgi:hypothetical protein